MLLNACTRLCGSRLTKPTVSTATQASPEGSVRRRAVGSSVANSMSASSTCAPQRRFSRLDFPTLVYPTSATTGTPLFSRLLRVSARRRSSSSRRSRSASMRRRTWRRSYSSLLFARAAAGACAAAPAAALTGQAGAKARQTGQTILQRGKLRLQFAFIRHGPACEYLQNQHGAVYDLHLQQLLQISDLAAGQLGVEHGALRAQG